MINFVLLQMIFVVVSGQLGHKVINGSSNAHACSLIIKSCQTRCKSQPRHYVRWHFDIIQHKMWCQLHGRVQSPPADATRNEHVVFDVKCCPKKRRVPTTTTTPTAALLPSPDPTNDDKMNTLIVLGVGTLLSILLICLFLFGGLLCYNKRCQLYYRFVKQENREKQREKREITRQRSKVKQLESNRVSEDISLRRQSYDEKVVFHNGTTVVPTLQSDYVTKNANFNPVAEEKKEKADEVLTNHVEIGQQYVNHLHIQNDNTVPVLDEAANSTSKKIAHRKQVAKEYELHGKFVSLQNDDVFQEESNYVRYPIIYKPESTNQCELHSNAILQKPKEEIKKKKEETEEVQEIEDPYVLAPPVKSVRCQQEALENLDAYQKLMPNGCDHNDNSDDYNILLHNSQVESQNSKVLLTLNNNFKPSTVDNKHIVSLKETHCDKV